MNQNFSKRDRILAIAPSARGFGFAVMEGRVILECGNKGARGDKNAHSLAKIERLMKRFQPDVVVLPDVDAKGCHRAPRIKTLHQQIKEFATKQKCKVRLISRSKLRTALLSDAKGTKYEICPLLRWPSTPIS